MTITTSLVLGSYYSFLYLHLKTSFYGLPCRSGWEGLSYRPGWEGLSYRPGWEELSYRPGWDNVAGHLNMSGGDRDRTSKMRYPSLKEASRLPARPKTPLSMPENRLSALNLVREKVNFL